MLVTTDAPFDDVEPLILPRHFVKSADSKSSSNTTEEVPVGSGMVEFLVAGIAMVVDVFVAVAVVRVVVVAEVVVVDVAVESVLVVVVVVVVVLTTQSYVKVRLMMWMMP